MGLKDSMPHTCSVIIIIIVIIASVGSDKIGTLRDPSSFGNWDDFKKCENLRQVELSCFFLLFLFFRCTIVVWDADQRAVMSILKMKTQHKR